MSNVSNEIAVQERKDFGKNASRRARKAGQIPGSWSMRMRGRS